MTAASAEASVHAFVGQSGATMIAPELTEAVVLVPVDPGDEVLYPDPSFPMYESITAFAGAKPVPIPLREGNEFRIDTDELERLAAGERDGIAVLSGWRRDLLGVELLALLDGRLSLVIHRGEVAVEERDAAAKR